MLGLEKFQWEVRELDRELLEIGEMVVKRAEELGASQAEAYVAASRSFTINVENSAIKSASEKRDAGCGIRSVIKNGGIGFAYVTTIQDGDLLEAAAKSVELARASVPDPDFFALPSHDGTYPAVKGLFDPAIQKLSSEKAAELIMRTVDATNEAAGSKQTAVEAQLNASAGTNAIVNSLGVSGSVETASMFIYSSPTVKDDNDQTSSFEFQVSRNLKNIDPEWVGSTAGRNAVNNLGGRTIEGGDMPVILTPLAVSTIIGGGFGGAINAEEIQYGRSYIADALGESIASEEISIMDDSHIAGGIGSRPFDAEGVPTQRTQILHRGVLKSILHNSYTANKDQVDNTGNASRPSYSGLPSISPSNLVIEPRKGALDDLVSEIKKGILFRYTGDRPNMTTGDLSAMVMEGHYIEDGAIEHSVKNTLVGINMRDLLQRVHRVGADVRVTSTVVTPSIVVESARVTSG
jgi:PmbA protein